MDVLRQALDQVRACLPASWALEVQEGVRRGGATFDAFLNTERAGWFQHDRGRRSQKAR